MLLHKSNYPIFASYVWNIGPDSSYGTRVNVTSTKITVSLRDVNSQRSKNYNYLKLLKGFNS